MSIVRTDNGESITLQINGKLEEETAPELRAITPEIVERHPKQVTLDLSGLDLIDSSGVAALVAVYKGVRANGGVVTVTGIRDQPKQIFKLLRMDKVFELDL